MDNNFGSITGVLLAAGLSRRMGSPKQLEMLGGKPLCVHAAASMWGADYDRLIAVVPAGETGQKIREALSGMTFEYIENSSPSLGMASSFRCAASILSGEAAVFALADMPLVSSSTHVLLKNEFVQRKPAVVLSYFGETLSPPHLFSAELFEKIANMPDGDSGPREIINAYLHSSSKIIAPEYELLDIDTKADLTKAIADQ